MERSSFKFLALFLSLLMCLYLFPTSVIAEALDSETDTVNDITDGTENESVKNENAFEVTELREESVKHFRLSDGTYVAAQYNAPVHYLDAEGKWQDIDNTLTDSGSDISTNDAKIKFAKKIPGNEVLFTLQKDNYKITMSLDGAIKKTSGVATNTVTEFDESATMLQKKMTLDKLTSRVMYADILDGVELFGLACLLERFHQGGGDVEVILDNSFSAVGDDEDICDARGDSLLDDVLDSGLVHDGEHFLRHGLCSREYSCTQTGGGDDCFCDFHVNLPFCLPCR